MKSSLGTKRALDSCVRSLLDDALAEERREELAQRRESHRDADEAHRRELDNFENRRRLESLARATKRLEAHNEKLKARLLEQGLDVEHI